LTAIQPQPSKLRLLRVFRVVVAAFQYCVRDFGQLFLVTWFACVLASLTRLVLEWLVFRETPILPDWMFSDHFYPPTWLSALLLTPFIAMGWAFVLNEMFDENPRRGIIVTPARELTWLRFEMGGPILIAAAILSAANLLDGLSRLAQQQILIVADVDPLGDTVIIWLAALSVARVVFMAFVFAWLYPLAGLVLQTGTFSFTRTNQILRGNRLRVAFIFLLLTAVLRGLDLLLEPATARLVGLLGDSSAWNLKTALVRFVVDFPFQMLWIVSWAVTVGIVLHTLQGRPASTLERTGEPPAAA
jgi:hypothetical protein